ncbi:hypothetical protein HDU98_003053, partial [Podochytrium sp. JEL0797]
GDMFAQDGKDLFLAMSDFMTRVLGIERDEWREMIDKAEKEWPVMRTFKNFYAVYAQVEK